MAAMEEAKSARAARAAAKVAQEMAEAVRVLAGAAAETSRVGAATRSPGAARDSVGSRSRRPDDTGPESVFQCILRGTTSPCPVGEEAAPPRQAPSAEACRAKYESLGAGSALRPRGRQGRGEGELRRTGRGGRRE